MLSVGKTLPRAFAFRSYAAFPSHAVVWTRGLSQVSPVDVISSWKKALSGKKADKIVASVQDAWRHLVLAQHNLKRDHHSSNHSGQSLGQPRETVSLIAMLSALAAESPTPIGLNMFLQTIEFTTKNKHHHHVGLLELLDAFLSKEDLSRAHDVLNEIQRLSLPLDKSCAERYLQVACRQCSIKDVKAIMRTQRMDENLLLIAAEPLILSGYTKTFSDFFEEHVQSTPQTPTSVLPLVKEILKARIRRSMTRCPLTALEQEGVENIDTQLENISTDSDDDNQDGHQSISDQALQNYLSFSAEWSGSDPPKGADVHAMPDSERNESESAQMRQMLMRNHSFPYLNSHKQLFFNDNNLPTPMADLTTQLDQQRPNVEVLLSASFFNDDLALELEVSERIAREILFAWDEKDNELFFGGDLSMVGDDEDDDDDDDDDNEDEDDDEDEDELNVLSAGDDEGDDSLENEFDDLEQLSLSLEDADIDEDHDKLLDNMYRSGQAKTLLKYEFNDISQSIKSSNSGAAVVEYAEDVFDCVSEDSFVRDGLLAQHRKDAWKHRRQREGLFADLLDPFNPDEDGGGISSHVRKSSKTKE